MELEVVLTDSAVQLPLFSHPYTLLRMQELFVKKGKYEFRGPTRNAFNCSAGQNLFFSNPAVIPNNIQCGFFKLRILRLLPHC